MQKFSVMQCLAGTDFVWNVGDEMELSSAEAKRLVEANIIAPIAEKKVETAKKKKKYEKRDN